MVGDKEVATSIRTQNEFWKRLDVVIEDQETPTPRDSEAGHPHDRSRDGGDYDEVGGP